MLGFQLDYPDNNSYAFRADKPKTKAAKITQPIAPDFSGTPSEGVNRCTVCRELLSKWDESLQGLVIRKRKYDISTTYDGLSVASSRFKKVYTENKLTGLVYRQLPDDPEFFGVFSDQTVHFDAQRRGTKFGPVCPQCGRHFHVTGADPVMLKAGVNIPDLGFVRTDLEFGTGDEKHYLLLCGRKAGAILGKAKLKGLISKPID